MKAIVKTKKTVGAELIEIPIPKPKANEVLVKPIAVSICGTDVHIYNWDSSARVYIKKVPQILGHEFAGKIVEAGKKVEKFKVGDYVSAETHIFCGKCIQCQNDQRHICKTRKIFGLTCNGCFAEYFTIPEKILWKNNSALEPEIATLQEPLGNAVYCALGNYDKDLDGKSVFIIGDGPAAMLATGVAKAEGARQVIILGRHERRLEITKQMGADWTFKDGEEIKGILSDITNGKGFDVVLEMAGSKEARTISLKWVREGGRISFFGIGEGPLIIKKYGPFVRSGIDIQAISGRRIWQTWEEVKKLLESGRLDITPVITHKLPLEEFEKGFDLMNARPKISGKVVLYP